MIDGPSIANRYDGVGNRIRHLGHNVTGDRKPVFERLCYNANNQLKKIWRPDRTDTEFEYDEAGNMTKKPETPYLFLRSSGEPGRAGPGPGG